MESFKLKQLNLKKLSRAVFAIAFDVFKLAFTFQLDCCDMYNGKKDQRIKNIFDY